MLSYNGYILKFDVWMSSSEIPEFVNEEITVKAKKLLQNADVVVYSGSLIPEQIK